MALAILWASGRSGVAAATPRPALSLEQGFDSPPAHARPMAYWSWLDGNVRPEFFATELRAYRDGGVSGLYIFDVGAKDPDNKIPAGPSFMGPESLAAMGRAIRDAGKLGMEMGIIVSSSWNAGGPWVRAEHASMGLYRARVTATGPQKYAAVLPMPEIPKAAPRDAAGRLRFMKNVAVLAIPQQQRLPGHEFIFELPDSTHSVQRAILYNTPSEDPKKYGDKQLFAKDFSVAVSTTSAEPNAFVEVARGTLQPHSRAQPFAFAPCQARYVRLLVYSGYNAAADRVELGEFELYTSDGRNIVSAYDADGSRTGAKLISCSSALGSPIESEWTAGNVHDGAKSGAGGAWSSAGPPPLQIESLDQIVDLTEQIDAAGRVVWDMPPGTWEIHRFVCANTGQKLAIPSPNSQGYAIDHFNPEATAMHFRTVLGRLRKVVGPFQKTALKYAYVCSYELRGAAWTPRMLQEFEKRRGYPMRRWLPALFGTVIHTSEYTARFQYDYRRTLGDLIVDAFYRRAREICHEYGLLLCAEAGGPGPPLHQVPVDALMAQGAIDIPRGEFWNAHNVWVVKETACAAHIYNKPVVDMEAFTSWRHWQDGPFELKPLADRAMCGGTNHFTFHTGSHSPPEAGVPGWVYHAGTHFNPRLAWWPMARSFSDYLARASFLLQQGVPVGDVCYYYGRQGFNFVPPKHVDPALGYGYDYDVTNAEVLLGAMRVDDHRLTLPHGVTYQALVLPDTDVMDVEVLTHIAELVKQGATVVGPKPRHAPGLAGYPDNDRQLRKLASQLWGDCDGHNIKAHAFGNGRVIWGKPLRDVLAQSNLPPDFSVAARFESVFDYIHRRAGDDDIYFVRNTTDKPVSATCRFRVTNRQPELWDAAAGTRVETGLYLQVGQHTAVPIHLAPYGSTFVVFRNAAGHHFTNIEPEGRGRSASVMATPEVIRDVGASTWQAIGGKPGTYELTDPNGNQQSVTIDGSVQTVSVTGPWTVTFDKNQVPDASVMFNQLRSWTEDSRDAIKYYSGSARYAATVDIPANSLHAAGDLWLDLGRVRFVADVRVNGKRAGVVWKPPFRVDIKPLAKRGSNQLEIVVANVWSNRLAGDARSKTTKPVCNTNMRYALSWELPWKDVPLHESGLLGPVRIEATPRVRLP